MPMTQYCAVATRAQIWSGLPDAHHERHQQSQLRFHRRPQRHSGVRGEITVGLVSSFLLYSRQFSRPFVEIANLYNTFQTAVAGAERVFEVLTKRRSRPDRPGRASAGADPAGMWNSKT
jgi:ATP-binding cassette subfamily B protein